jgi:protein gp37
LSKIEWTDETLNVSVGCTRVSPGCDHCYAARMAHRGLSPKYRWLTTTTKNGPQWTGEVRLAPEAIDIPRRWIRPRLVFVNSMSDLFHPRIPYEYLQRVFEMFRDCPKHTFQILTKHPDRLAEFLDERGRAFDWPLPHVWLGFSAEDQERFDPRVCTIIHRCAWADVKWVSLEPMLGPISLRGTGHLHLGWVVVGGESGPNARPMDPGWVRAVRDECAEWDVPFLFKQWGQLSNNPDPEDPTAHENGGPNKGGRMLDGRIHDAWPNVDYLSDTPLFGSL